MWMVCTILPTISDGSEKNFRNLPSRGKDSGPMDEIVPDDWPVQGSTGYDFMNYVNGLFCDRANVKKLSIDLLEPDWIEAFLRPSAA